MDGFRSNRNSASLQFMHFLKRNSASCSQLGYILMVTPGCRVTLKMFCPFASCCSHMGSMLPGYPTEDPVTSCNLGRAQVRLLKNPPPTQGHVSGVLNSTVLPVSCSMYPTVLSLFCDSSLDSKLCSYFA